MSRTGISHHNHGFEGLQEINFVLIYRNIHRQFGLDSIAGIFANFLPQM